MQVNGIIAEYNPFHNGHRYHLTETLSRTGADYTIVVMSGDFVQRGAPALLDKHRRAEMALRCGADLVLELPVLYAASSAEYFASGAVALLDKLGVVTHLSFGSECGDTELLRQIAEILVREPPEYTATLKKLLQQGLSYPLARTKALLQHYPFLDNHREVFSSPNNILGIEYIKALIRRDSAITPAALLRKGSGYHDRQTSGSYCSALAIRQALCSGHTPPALSQLMPEESAGLLLDFLSSRSPVRANDFSGLLHYKLVLEEAEGYQRYLDVSPDLSDRIRNRLPEYVCFEDFCDLLKTKELTYTRISRCLLHILLNLTKEDMTLGQSLDNAAYARVLGFKRSAAPLLSAIGRASSIPLVTKLADAGQILSPEALQLLSRDILAANIYQTVAGSGRTPVNEYTVPLCIIP